MNKKLVGLIVLIAFLPAIFAGVWYLSVAGVKLTPANVSVVTLSSEFSPEASFTSKEDKAFFIDLKAGFVPIEKQEIDSDEYSTYALGFNRIQGDVSYTLCLSADTRSCFAYDVNNNWYRIEKEKAQKLLIDYQIYDVYKYSTIPTLDILNYKAENEFSPIEANWNYLVADDSYKNISVQEGADVELTVSLSSLADFDVHFQVEPDWYNVKLYDGDLLVYDGILDNPSDFNLFGDSLLRAVVSARWYEGSNDLFYGEATYECGISYDVPTTYSLSKNTINTGEVLYLQLFNADDEIFDVSCSFVDSKMEVHEYTNGKLILIPIPMDLETGEYSVELHSEKTHLNIPINVNSKNFESVKIGLIRSENPDEYSEALKNFKNEISSAKDVLLRERYAFDGWITPITKFVNGKEQYWVSAPSYGVKQILDGVEISERNFGVHYVKSVESQKLEVRAVAQGKVAFSGTTTAYGNTVVIEHGYGLKSVYGHLDEVNVDVGDDVDCGQVFAVASPKAFSIASKELFFAVYVNEIFVNPFNFINEPRKSTDAEKTDPIDFFVKG